jgi:hypothetical protein
VANCPWLFFSLTQFDGRKSLQEEARGGRVAAVFLVGYLPQRYNRPSKQDALPGKFRSLSQDETYVVPAVGSKFAPDFGRRQVHA